MKEYKEYQDKHRLDYAYHNVPEHTRTSLELYFFEGVEPGGFLYSVLTNDLMGACTRCDHINREAIVDIVKWMIHRAPQGSWGHRQRILDWMHDKDQCRTKFVTEWEKRVMWEILSEQ